MNRHKMMKKQHEHNEHTSDSAAEDTLFVADTFFNGGGNRSGGDVRIEAIVLLAFLNESLCTKLFSNDIADD